MTNRYCNLNGNDNISDTYDEISEGFDGVQADIDAHAATLTNHQQQITTNDQARIAADAAHAASTTAHSADHITYSGIVAGASNVKQMGDNLNTRVDNLVLNGDSSPAAADAAPGLDGTPHASLKARLDYMEAKQLDAQDQRKTLVHGLNYLDTDIASDLEVEVGGVTLTNRFGRTGKQFTGWGVSACTVAIVNDWVEITLSAGQTIADVYFDYNVESGKYYIFVADVANINASTLRTVNYGTATFGDPYSSTSEGISFVKFNPSSSTTHRLSVRVEGVEGQKAKARRSRLYEVSAADYAAIDTMSADQVAARWPYVDSVQHLENPILTVQGKNLLPTFTEWTLDGHEDVVEPYKLTLNATANSQGASIMVPVLPSKTYKLFVERITSNGWTVIQFYDANQNFISVVDGSFVESGDRTAFTTTSNTHYVLVGVGNNTSGAGTYTFENPQLELGSTATNFVAASPKYLYAQGTFASNVDRSVRDRLYYQNKQWYKHKRFETGVSLSDFTWEFGADDTGFKRIRSYSVSPRPVIGSQDIVKYDGSIIRKFSDNNAWDAGDKANIYFDGTSSYLDLTANDADSGWGEDYTPSSDEIKAYFYGYKMYPASGAFNQTYSSGTKAWCYPDGSGGYLAGGTTLPTSQAPNVAPYVLDYQLAAPVTEAVTVEGALSVPAGGAMVSLAEGVVVREPIVPQLSGGFYFINTNTPSALLDNRLAEFISIDKGLDPDDGWIIGNNTLTDLALGGTYFAKKAEADFDGTKKYYVTYTLLDKYKNTANAVDADVAYQGSDHAVLARVVEKMADDETNISILKIAYLKLQAQVDALT